MTECIGIYLFFFFWVNNKKGKIYYYANFIYNFSKLYINENGQENDLQFEVLFFPFKLRNANNKHMNFKGNDWKSPLEAIKQVFNKSLLRLYKS